MKKVFFCIAFLNLFGSYLFAQNTYLDNFNTISYSNNNGSHNWATNWIETEPYSADNNPSNGYIRITGNRLRFRFIWTERIQRRADLSGTTSAVLSFNWQTQSLESGERLRMQISTSGTGGWVTLFDFSGSSTGVFSQDISSYISATTTIRFRKNGGNWSDNSDTVYIDNFLITASPKTVITNRNITYRVDPN